MTGAYEFCVISAAWEGKFIETTAAKFEPLEQAGASIVDHSLDRSTGLLLNDRGPCPDFAITNNVTDPNFHQVATAQLAIESKIEKRSIPKPSVLIKEETDCPNPAGLEGSLRANFSSCVPRHPLASGGIKF